MAAEAQAAAGPAAAERPAEARPAGSAAVKAVSTVELEPRGALHRARGRSPSGVRLPCRPTRPRSGTPSPRQSRRRPSLPEPTRGRERPCGFPRAAPPPPRVPPPAAAGGEPGSPRLRRGSGRRRRRRAPVAAPADRPDAEGGHRGERRDSSRGHPDGHGNRADEAAEAARLARSCERAGPGETGADDRPGVLELVRGRDEGEAGEDLGRRGDRGACSPDSACSPRREPGRRDGSRASRPARGTAPPAGRARRSGPARAAAGAT